MDYANQAIEQGHSAAEAMIEAAHLRLRPVLMTAFSTIFGMIPIALATSDGAELRTSMGILVIGGLISSTVLTLFVVPVVYTLLADAESQLCPSIKIGNLNKMDALQLEKFTSCSAPGSVLTVICH